MRRLASSLAFALALHVYSSAHAQRGELVEPIDRESSRLDGFPGTFNAAMPAQGEWRLELGTTPSLSYGLHPDATVTTSLLPIVSWAARQPAASAELRYRLWYDRAWAVVGTFGGMLLRLPEGMAARTVKASLTGEWRYGPRSALALTVLVGGGVAREVDEMQLETTYALQGIGAMASYSFFPAAWFGFDVGIGVAPRLDVQIGGSGGTSQVNLGELLETTGGLGGRLALHFKPGRTWLVDLGVVVLPPYIPVPHAGVSKRW